jgi:hypothetical protein
MAQLRIAFSFLIVPVCGRMTNRNVNLLYLKSKSKYILGSGTSLWPQGKASISPIPCHDLPWDKCVIALESNGLGIAVTY